MSSPETRDYKPGWTILYVNARVPSELKYLINYYKSVAKLPSFNWAVRQLLETHPALAKLAADLYTQGRIIDGLDTSPPSINSGDSRNDRGPSTVAGLFLGQLRSCQVPDSRWNHALCGFTCGSGPRSGDGGIMAVSTLQTAQPALGTVSRQPQTTAQPAGAGAPFSRMSRQMQILGPVTAGLAFGALFTPQIKPVGGYIRYYPLYVMATGGTGTVAVASADAPWNTIQNLFLRDPFGQPIIQADGYSLYLIDLYGGQSGVFGFGNQTPSLPSFQGMQLNGNFQFRIHLPFEMDSSGYCSLPAMNAASQPSIWVQTNPSSVVYTTAPTTVPTLTLQLDEEFWAAPVDNPQFAPPDVGSSAQWSITKAPTGIASNQFQRIVLPRVGALTTTLIVILRDSTGARIDGYPPSDLSLWVDGVPHLYEMFNERTDKMYAAFGVTRPTGVVVYTFRNSVQTFVSTADTYDLILPTSPATLLEIAGTWGSGTGTPLNGGQGSIANAPAQLYQLTQELYPLGGIPYTHLAQ